MERNQYLQHPLVEGVVYEITDSKVEIACPHPSFYVLAERRKSHCQK